MFLTSFLTNNKDANILILSKLEFSDLREILTVNKATSKYNNNVLWFNYSKRRPDFELMEKVISRPWKEFSLCLIQFLDLSRGNCNRWMSLSAKGGYLDLVKFSISKGANDWNWGMECAALGGHKDLVDFFISKGARDWNLGMYGASQAGSPDLVEFFITQGANDWNLGMLGAAQKGNRNLVEFFVSKGANDWNIGMSGAAEGHLELVEFFISKGANNWQWGLESAKQEGSKDLFTFFRRKLFGF